MKRGTLKANALAVSSFTVDFTKTTLDFESTVALLQPEAQAHPVGWTKFREWSPTTMAKLMELRAAMEDDIAAKMLSSEDAPATAAGGVGLQSPSTPTGSSGGLGEHVGAGTADAQQA